MNFSDFWKKNKEIIAGFACFFIIIIEIIFLWRPFLSTPTKGTYRCEEEYIRLSTDTYETKYKKGFYYFTDEVPFWFAQEYSNSAIVLDNDDVYAIKSAFSICNTKTDNVLISTRAIFIQIVISAFFVVFVYIAYIKKDNNEVKQKTKYDENFNMELLKGFLNSEKIDSVDQTEETPPRA